MNKFSRLLRHLFTTTAAARRVFPDAALQAIEAAIVEGEKKHRAEVLVIVEPGLPMQAVLSGMTARDRARELFALHAIWDTEENSGVLVYINLADHQVELVADRGVGRIIPQDEWNRICREMTGGFARGNFLDSTLKALQQLNALLTRHYPDDGSTPNQLGNRPVML